MYIFPPSSTHSSLNIKYMTAFLHVLPHFHLFSIRLLHDNRRADHVTHPSIHWKKTSFKAWVTTATDSLFFEKKVLLLPEPCPYLAVELQYVRGQSLTACLEENGSGWQNLMTYGVRGGTISLTSFPTWGLDSWNDSNKSGDPMEPHGAIEGINELWKSKNWIWHHSYPCIVLSINSSEILGNRNVDVVKFIKCIYLGLGTGLLRC